MDGLFKKFYNKTEGLLKAMKEPLIQRRIQNMITSYRDSLLDKMQNCINNYITSLESIEDCDKEAFKSIVQNRKEYDDLDSECRRTEKIYKEIFGKDMEKLELPTMDDVYNNILNTDANK